jgi:hypothetical protein
MNCMQSLNQTTVPKSQPRGAAWPAESAAIGDETFLTGVSQRASGHTAAV